MSIYFVFLVGIGGGLGSICRYLLSTLLISFSPWITVLINVTGGFVIGFVFRYTENLSSAEQIRAFWIIGVCGGFTTFSAFGLDFFHLFKNGQIILGMIYICLSVACTILAVFLGMRAFQFFS